ncbi:LVIVD repeat-containing protein [Persicitalea jodogahamensis]|uniref:LVIVD repeat-containing protein n=1 Tax=Persicitalea jodogahamensis TaxID=402147 RepID=A0A8J3D3F3_9BACT|nr:hypothetical protein [Persicitalea jodogahamensis]GHB65185.1 hypothetical protein GCM10007390_19100 [Persicitalea jodogahamensis]
MKKSISILSLLLVFGLISCDPAVDRTVGGPEFEGTGYRAVYATAEEIAKIETQAPRPLRQPGKIYVQGNYLFVNEQGEGVHVIDNTDPAKPLKISFLKIPGNNDIAAKGQYLYADNARDLVVINIADPTSVKLVKRIENAIPSQDYPSLQQVYFECPDSKKGVIIAWEKVSMASPPACFR